MFSNDFIGQANVTYAIVSHRMFEGELQPFIKWKRKKGFHVITAYTDEIGSSRNEIKEYLKNLYYNPSLGVSPPTFVLLVGDHQQINGWWGIDQSITDLHYADYDYNYIPDVYCGRFSAQTPSQLEPQIAKTIKYEKYTLPNHQYLMNNTLVSSARIEDIALTYINGAVKYAHNNYCHPGNGINPLVYLNLDETNSTVMCSTDSNALNSIINKVNNGVGRMHFFGHCNGGGWNGPFFRKEHVDSLTNYNKYGVWIGNCCFSAYFAVDECFGEKLLRLEDRGAVGYIGTTNLTNWDEEYWWIVGLSGVSSNIQYNESDRGIYEGLFHNKYNEANNPGTWFITQAQSMVCGNLAVESSTSTIKEYYWEFYNLLGDPSLMPYLGMAASQEQDINIFDTAIVVGKKSIFIEAGSSTQVGLSQDGNLIANATTKPLENNQLAGLFFNPQELDTGYAEIIFTGQNKVPYFDTIEVYVPDQPHVEVNEYAFYQQPEYGQQNNNFIKVNVKNFTPINSELDAQGVSAKLKTSDPYIIITDSIESFGDINAGDSVTVDSCFSFSISNQIPDNHNILCQLLISYQDTTISSTTSYLLFDFDSQPLSLIDISSTGSPYLVTSPRTWVGESEPYLYVVQAEQNGFNPGADIEMEYAIRNNSIAGLSSCGWAFLNSTNGDITINTDTLVFDKLPYNSKKMIKFSLSIDEAVLPGDEFNLYLHVFFNDAYQLYDTSTFLVENSWVESFESGNFSQLDWQHQGDANWVIDNTSSHGYFSAKSGEVGHNDSSTIKINFELENDKMLSFYKKTSCEPNSDKLIFLIDGELKSYWSGESTWQKVFFPLEIGEHTLQWTYSKNFVISTAEDCSWIDYLQIGNKNPSQNGVIEIYDSILPSWLTLTDNHDGTAILQGTPSLTDTGWHEVVICSKIDTMKTIQQFDIKVTLQGVEDRTLPQEMLTVFPNPVDDVLNIHFNHEIPKNLVFTIKNCQGKTIDVIDTRMKHRTYKFNTAHYKEGLYFVVINVQNTSYIKKFVKL